MLPHRLELEQRYASNPSFREEMVEAESKYKQILQRALYSDLSDMSPKLIVQAGRDEEEHSVLFVFGREQPSNKKGVDKLYMHLIKFMDERLDSKEFQPYSIVYFNTCCGYSNYSTFKNILRTLPLKYFVNLKKIVIVDPSFTIKALEWFVTGAINNTIYALSKYATTFQELKNHKIPMSAHKLSLIPRYIKQSKNSEISRLTLRESIQTRISKQEPKKVTRTKKLRLEDYEVNQLGVPIGLYLMISYFMLRKEGLKEEGLFRKSVVKQEVDEAMEFVKMKYYDFLQDISNPHIVANMITRFIGDFEQPLIPYSVYNQFVHDEGKTSQVSYIKQVLQALPTRNHVTLLYLFDFLLDEVVPLREFNKMTTYNLAVVLSPCLLRSGKEVAIQELMYSKKLVLIMEFILNNYNEIFGSREERLGVFRMSEKMEKTRFIQEKIEGGKGGKGEGEGEEESEQDSERGSYDIEEAYMEMGLMETDSVYGEQLEKKGEEGEIGMPPQSIDCQQKPDLVEQKPSPSPPSPPPSPLPQPSVQIQAQSPERADHLDQDDK